MAVHSFANWAPIMCFIQGDGKPFWKHVVSEATGCDSVDYFEEVYEVYFVNLADLNNSICILSCFLWFMKEWLGQEQGCINLCDWSHHIFTSTMPTVMHGIFLKELMKLCCPWKILEVISSLYLTTFCRIGVVALYTAIYIPTENEWLVQLN